MTPTIEKLLALAATYEEKAKALRFAAAELNGHLTPTITVTPEPMPDTDDKRTQVWIRDCLAKGPRRTTEVITYLHTQGIDLSKQVARRLLTEMPDVKHTGATITARWQLRGRAGKTAEAS